MNDIKALTFDTGGTILDWHTGFSTVLETLGKAHGLEADWSLVTNDLRRASLRRMVNLGEHEAPAYNFDGAHKAALDEVLHTHALMAFSEEERRAVWWDTAHSLKCWPDFPPALNRYRQRYLCVSFTLLSMRIIMDTARRNNLHWDAVLSCEAIGKYKVLPESYLRTAELLQLEPAQICMVACHNFDLNGAQDAGFRTAFVRRPTEWGPSGPPDPNPNRDYDFVEDGFEELVSSVLQTT